jgi:hypothetical protein
MGRAFLGVNSIFRDVPRCPFRFPRRKLSISGAFIPTQVEGSSRWRRFDVFERPCQPFADSTGVARECAGTRVVNLAVL